MLLTSAPVVIKCIATSMLPLDLHVLSLSLAFILSQDQTLRCQYIVFSLSRINLDNEVTSGARPAINRLFVSRTERELSPAPICRARGRCHADGTAAGPFSCTCFLLLQHFNDRTPQFWRQKNRSLILSNREAKVEQNYCLFPKRQNFSPTFFRKYRRTLLSTCRFRFAGAKLLPISLTTKFFRNFFSKKLQENHKELIMNGIQFHARYEIRDAR